MSRPPGFARLFAAVGQEHQGHPTPENALIKESDPRLLAESVVLGVIGALAAQVFTWALRLCEHFFLIWMAGYHPPGLPEEGGVLKQVIGPHGLILIPLATTLGGLLSGLLVYSFAPEAEGHGTDTVVKAFHRTGGFIRARVAPLKLVASAITIGSGGAAGREGPTALIGAGVGSIYATFFHRKDEDRGLIVLMGMAAGLSAIFRSPIGAAFFAIEVLYGRMEFEAGALLYTMLSSVVAYAVNTLFVGNSPLFFFPSEQLNILPTAYLWFGALGLAGGLIATLLPVAFYRLRDLFRSLPWPAWANPALGGLCLGLIAMKLPQILGGGYGWIQEAIDGQIALKLLLVLLFAKILGFGLTVSSGGSGGVFAPTLFVGAMLGGVMASFAHLPAAAFVVIGMVAVFGAAAHVPVAALIMVTEMTGGYQLLPGAAFAVLLSYLVQTRLSAPFKYHSLYEAQVLSRAASPARYVENVESALKILGTRKLPSSTPLGHLDLVNVLDSGVGVEIPGRKELNIGVVGQRSSLVGKTVRDCMAITGKDSLEIVAVLRATEVALPTPGSVLQEGDRILVLGSAKARAKLFAYLTSESPPPAK